MSGPEMITLGCRLNVAESDTMRRLAAGEQDLVIVNSCAVTNEAVRQTRQAIRRAKRARPSARIVVTGCAAQVDPASFAAMPEVSRVLGNGEKMKAVSFLSDDGPEVRVSDIMTVAEQAPHLVSGYGERSRAFVEVQNGCDHRCTFCIIPFGRGASRSVPAGLIVDRIAQLVDEGHHEIVLTGVDVTSYGADLPGRPKLGRLVEQILNHVPGLARLRLSSLDCIEIDDRLFDLATGEPRFMPHLHMSFQAGDDLILKRMKRRHRRADAVAIVERLKAARPDLAIGADLIAGFPTESPEMHENSLRLIDECDIIMAHVFPYSPKAGTSAARMPPVDPETIRTRARRLRDAGRRRRLAWLDSLIGTRQKVLTERNDGGHAENFAPVRVKGAPAGALLDVRIVGREEEILIGVSE